MKLKKEYRPYIWSLITLILSVSIIFTSSLIFGSLLNISALSENFPDEFTLDLPDVSGIISSSIGQTDKPVYFPSGSGTGSELYTLEKLSNTDSLFDSVVSVFLENVSFAMQMLFDFNPYATSSDQKAQKCTLWGIYSKETNHRVDTMVSFNIVLLDNNNTLWSVTAYGNSKAITHLERSLYYSPVFSDKGSASESINKNIQVDIESIVAFMSILGDTLGLPQSEKNNDYTSYINGLDYDLKEQNDTEDIYEVYSKELGMTFNISVSHFYELLAVTRVK